MLALHLFWNQLTSLPESIGKLENLIHLLVQNNQLTSLPDSIGQLENLLFLYVYNNQLTSLPESIGKLEKLLEIFAWNNTLTALPDTVGNMKSLRDVDIRHNNLVKLPSTINEWNGIEYFYIAGNKVCDNIDLPSNFDIAKGLCEEQCSVDYPSGWRGDGECDDNDYVYDWVKFYQIPLDVKPKPNSGCNTKSCNYDNGDCPR